MSNRKPMHPNEYKCEIIALSLRDNVYTLEKSNS